MSAPKVVAFSLNPLSWLGDAASSAVGDVWKAAMTGLWSAALWILKLAFRIIDEFTAPDLSAGGPMGGILPTTLWLGATLAVAMMFIQLLVALLRRDGESMGKLIVGIFQFGLVWAGYLGVAAGLVAGASGLSTGILDAMLHVRTMSGFDFSASWPHSIDDVTLATVLGVLSILLVIPAAFFYVLIMLVREAALIILVATAPISAGGLLADVGKAWFWKTTRWFFSCLLISPCAALLLGIGVKLSDGVINPVPPFPQWCAQQPGRCLGGNAVKSLGTYASTANADSAGMAIVGCIVIAIGAICPLVLFRLLAFVEPSTASGAALRQSWSDGGGMAGLMRGSSAGGGGGSAATQLVADGRSGGESGSEAQTSGRLATALGTAGAGMRVASSLAHRAADIGSDVLGSAGVGSQGYSMTPTDERSRRSTTRIGQHTASTALPQSDEPAPPPPPAPAAPPAVPSPPPSTPGSGSAPGADRSGPAAPPDVP